MRHEIVCPHCRVRTDLELVPVSEIRQGDEIFSGRPARWMVVKNITGNPMAMVFEAARGTASSTYSYVEEVLRRARVPAERRRKRVTYGAQ